MKSHLVNYAKWLVWQYYQTEGNTKLAIWMAWAPAIPKKASDDARFFANAGFDLIRPDYYGLARSDGYFSPQGCVQTLVDTVSTIQSGWSLLSIYSRDEVVVPMYDEIVVVGASYGWWIAAIAPKIISSIKEIILLYPWFAEDDMNQRGYLEEWDEEFIRQYSLQKSLYRFAPWVDPYEALIDITAFDSLHDMSHLHHTKIFVWHGSADDCIWSGRSRQWVDSLRQMNPDGQYHYAEYYGLWHGGVCKEAILRGWLYWRKGRSEGL